MDRRKFISFSGMAGIASFFPLKLDDPYVMTVSGKIPKAHLGRTLAHEHIITDFAGAEKNLVPIYRNSEALNKVLPHLKELKKGGTATVIECTPAYIGRNVLLLKLLAETSGLNLVTNTGYYAAVGEKYIPKHAFSESAEQISLRWQAEWESGIDGTGIRPGFIKLGVDNGPLKDLEKKLIRAAAFTHLKTGLKIFIHTGNAQAAREEATLLTEMGVAAEALIWVHAQNDTNGDTQVDLARMGCWISLDGVNAREETIQQYVKMISRMKREKLLHKILISHDDGFSVEVLPDGSPYFTPYNNGNVSPYQTIFKKLKPALLANGISEQDFDGLLTRNPAQALQIKVCSAKY
jgi:phosphotriesterase-related protein